MIGLFPCVLFRVSSVNAAGPFSVTQRAGWGWGWGGGVGWGVGGGAGKD